MADDLPRADETQRGQRSWIRDWYSYERYQVVHENHMEALVREGLVLRDTLTFREVRDHGALLEVNLRGRVVCAHRVVLVVNKWLRVRRGHTGHYQVLGEFYAYHAHRRGPPPVPLLRYDNAHGSGLHRHFFDQAGREISVQTVSFESLPRLDLVIREAIALETGATIPSAQRRPD